MNKIISLIISWIIIFIYYLSLDNNITTEINKNLGAFSFGALVYIGTDYIIKKICQ